MNRQATIRPLHPQETRSIAQWTKEEGWNIGLHDTQVYQNFSATSLIGAFVEQQLVGVSAVFLYNPRYAFFGLYRIKPDFRGQGYGLAMTRYRLQAARHRNVGLESSLENTHRYRHIRFRSDYRHQRYYFKGHEESLPDNIIDISEIPLAKVIQFERQIYGEDRDTFLRCWLTYPKFTTKILVRDGHIRGYFVLRPTSDNECRLGSFTADSLADAEHLLRAAQYFSKGKGLYIDMPENNPNAQTLVQTFNGQLLFESVRMYKGYALDINHHKVYGIASLEAG